MKKILSVLLVLVLAVFITGCGDEPKPGNTNVSADPDPVVAVEDESLTELREEIRDSGKLFGVAYLGWLEGDFEEARAELLEQEYIKNIPFIEDIDTCAENEGYRMYCVVPADETVSLTVCKCEFGEEYLPYDGEELTSSENGEPLLIRGNMSDTIPNLFIIAKKGSEKVEYTPAQSGMDGRLENSDSRVYDFTPYDLMQEFGAYDRVPDAVFCGDWICFTPDSSGEETAMLLTLEPEGYVSYAYGYGNSEIFEQFEGYWEMNDDILTLYMTGGPEAGMEPYDLIGEFEWDITAEGLTLTHMSGGVLLYGTDGGTFEFVSNEY